MMLQSNEGKLFDVKDNIVLEMDPHGMKMGWAHWPINFDPVWVKICKFFKEK